MALYICKKCKKEYTITSTTTKVIGGEVKTFCSEQNEELVCCGEKLKTEFKGYPTGYKAETDRR